MRASDSSSKRLTTARSGSTAIRRAGAALRQNIPVACSHAEITASSGISCWQSTASEGASSKSPSRRFAPGETTIVVSPAASTVIRATPVGSSVSRTSSSTPASRSPASASSANASRPTAPTNVTLAPRRAHATAWFAPLPPGNRASVAPLTVSPGRGSCSQRTTRSRLTEPTTVMRGAGTGPSVLRVRLKPHPLPSVSYAARARRSSTVEPSNVSRRSKRPAHSDERSGELSRRAASARPSSARTSTASSR